jgi:hypothetical protein
MIPGGRGVRRARVGGAGEGNPRMGPAWGLALAVLLSGCGAIETVPSPEVFAPGVVSDEREQYRITFTLSGDTAYFGAGEGFFPQTREAHIDRSIRIGGEWQMPEVASFSGHYSDIDPFITPDGRHLYFSSIRPTGSASDAEDSTGDVVDLWRVPREEGRWGSPERLAISTPADDLYPSLDQHGNLYFANPVPRGEGPGHWRIVVARATPEGFAEPEPVRGGVNSERSWAFNPAVSPDGRQMVFTRLDPVEPQATGFGELYLSRLDEAGEWSEAVNLGRPVNTPMDEYHPSFSADGTTLYFVRRDVSAETPNGKLYRITARILVR